MNCELSTLCPNFCCAYVRRFSQLHEGFLSSLSVFVSVPVCVCVCAFVHCCLCVFFCFFFCVPASFLSVSCCLLWSHLLDSSLVFTAFPLKGAANDRKGSSSCQGWKAGEDRGGKRVISEGRARGREEGEGVHWY